MAFHNIPPNGFPDIPDMEELEAVVKDVASIKTSVAGLSTDVSNLSDNKANQITIAPFFNAETAYEVGDLVYYNGLSYRCTNDHEGEWDADDFAATTVSNELDTLKSGLTSVETSPTFSSLYAKTFGKLAIISGYFTGDGTATVNLNLCSGYYGILSVRNGSNGVLGVYEFNNGSISGWDGSQNRQFTDSVQYLVSGVLVKLG